MQLVNVKQTPTEQVIQMAVDVLQAGGLVIFPTETVYGAGVDATNAQAVAKLLAFKSRREGKPLSIAVSDQQMAEKYVEINEQAAKLYQSLLPGPVTVVSKGLGQVAPGVESEFNTLGVRIPDYDLVRAVVGALGHPITATSANASGKPRPYSPTTALKHLSAKQKSLIDLILDAGELPHHPPSIVIDTTLSTPLVMRDLSTSPASLNSSTANSTTYTTKSEVETSHLAGKLLLKYWDQVKTAGLVIGLNGVLGAGKTVFARGMADFLQINEIITSPTYNYIEEYDFNRHGTRGVLHHVDVWKIDSPNMIERLELAKLIAPCHILAIEWFENIADNFLPHIKKQKVPFIQVDISATHQITVIEQS